MPKLGSKVKMDTLPLTYTPRRLAFHPSQQYLYCIETDHRTLSAPATAAKLKGIVGVVFLPFRTVILTFTPCPEKCGTIHAAAGAIRSSSSRSWQLGVMYQGGQRQLASGRSHPRLVASRQQRSSVLDGCCAFFSEKQRATSGCWNCQGHHSCATHLHSWLFASVRHDQGRRRFGAIACGASTMTCSNWLTV